MTRKILVWTKCIIRKIVIVYFIIYIAAGVLTITLTMHLGALHDIYSRPDIGDRMLDYALICGVIGGFTAWASQIKLTPIKARCLFYISGMIIFASALLLVCGALLTFADYNAHFISIVSLLLWAYGLSLCLLTLIYSLSLAIQEKINQTCWWRRYERFGK